ncbi:MAG TPA: hypothetical protein VF491_13545 [Vicinamibacterales bacterium]|jgi:hypothetical protein
MKRVFASLFATVALTVPAAAQQVPKGQMPILGRATESTDKVPLLDFENYFVGKWTFEWSMPDSPLGPAGPYTGTTVVTKIDDTFFEAVSEGEGPAGTFKVREVIAYNKENKTVARQVTDSRGFDYLQFGPVGGDLGGIYNLHFDSAPFTINGKTVRIKHTLRLLSPLNYRVASSISVDGGPFTNLGNPWWRKAP